MAFEKKDEAPKYEFITDPCVINTRGDKGWKLELNQIRWNPSDLETKYDIRVWSPDHKTMGKGISLSKIEISKLKDILNQDDTI